MLNKPTDKILQKLAALENRFNYQNDRFAKEFLRHKEVN